MEQAAALRARHYELLDWENVAEEIESLGRSERNELESRLMRTLVHLLKSQFQSNRRSRRWEVTLIVQRTRLCRLLKESPSLRTVVPEYTLEAYATARRVAGVEMKLARGAEPFPDQCPWTIEQILDLDFYPQPTR
jgi:hypothetical protein